MEFYITLAIATLLNLAALYIEWRDSTVKFDKLQADNAALAKRVRKLEYEHTWFGKQFAAQADQIAKLENDRTFQVDQIANLEDGLLQTRPATSSTAQFATGKRPNFAVFDHLFQPITPPAIHDTEAQG